MNSESQKLGNKTTHRLKKSGSGGPLDKFQSKKEELCPYCQIPISLQSIDTHVKYCKKKPKPTSIRMVSVYNSSVARIQGTEIQWFLRDQQLRRYQARKHTRSSKNPKPVPTTAENQNKPQDEKVAGKTYVKLPETSNEYLNANAESKNLKTTNWRESHSSTLNRMRADRKAFFQNENLYRSKTR